LGGNVFNWYAFSLSEITQNMPMLQVVHYECFMYFGRYFFVRKWTMKFRFRTALMMNDSVMEWTMIE